MKYKYGIKVNPLEKGKKPKRGYLAANMGDFHYQFKRKKDNSCPIEISNKIDNTAADFVRETGKNIEIKVTSP